MPHKLWSLLRAIALLTTQPLVLCEILAHSALPKLVWLHPFVIGCYNPCVIGVGVAGRMPVVVSVRQMTSAWASAMRVLIRLPCCDAAVAHWTFQSTPATRWVQRVPSSRLRALECFLRLGHDGHFLSVYEWYFGRTQPIGGMKDGD